MSPVPPGEPTHPAAAGGGSVQPHADPDTPAPDATPNPQGGTSPATNTSSPPSTGAQQFRMMLEQIAQSSSMTSAAPAVAPSVALPVIPGYEVLGEIARGGMGRVLSAHDVKLNRPVAIKVMLGGWTANAGRFVRESLITARLPHPGIPPVHALGELADGSPFLAMKLIQGRTLAALLADRANPSIDLPRFEGIFEQVCQAVAFAHSQGIIHRDLKPGNVMVGAFGEVQVMDWGLAKDLASGRVHPGRAADAPEDGRDEPGRSPGLDSPDDTQAGTVLGTPAYMAPEQARGESVDERSDVFALGGILCTILTGHAPFAGIDVRSTLQLAAAGDLTPALARLGSCGADPDLVALAVRCLSPDPADRPADAGVVAALVTAYRAGVEERLRKAETDRAAAEVRVEEQRKRRRVKSMLAAAVGLLLLGAVAVGWWRERVQGERKAVAARHTQAADTLLDECEGHLGNEDTERAGAALAGAERRLSEGGADHLRPRLERCQHELHMLKELENIDNFLWTPVEGKAPDRKAATGQWESAFRAFGLVHGETPPAEAARVLAAAFIRERLLSALDLWLASAPSAGVRDWLRAADPHPFRDAIRDAILTGDQKSAVARAETPEALDQPARFAVVLGQLPELGGKRVTAILAEARRRHPRSLAVVMALGHGLPAFQKATANERLRHYEAAVSIRPDNASAWNCRGLALKDRGDLDEAIACYQEAIRLDPKYGAAHNNLGIALNEKGEIDRAITLHRRAMELDPTDARPHSNLAIVLVRKRDLDGALASLREAIRLDPKYAKAHNNLGMVLEAKGDRATAITHYREAIRLDPTDARFHANLGVALARSRDIDGAIVSFRESVRLDPTDARFHFNLSNALRAKGDLDATITSAREAIRLDPTLTGAHFVLGNALDEKGELDAASAAFREVVRLDPSNAAGHSNLGSTLIRKGDLAGAVASFEAAARLQPNNPTIQKNLTIARNLKAVRDAKEALIAPPPREVKR